MKNPLITILKSIDVAFSMYSKIPMPRFTWASEDMKYHLCFFPAVGALIGAVIFGWYKLCSHFDIGNIMFLMITIIIPILITGGFHIDGFMDTMDALSSYQSRERKLEILKDSHIGAFCVICLGVYMLMLIGFMSEIDNDKAVKVLCVCPVISRALSGISVVCFKPASNKGMLHTSESTAHKTIVKIFLAFEVILSMILMIIISPIFALLSILGQILSFIYYYFLSYKQFGGITGDLAGFFVVICEFISVAMVSVGCIFLM